MIDFQGKERILPLRGSCSSLDYGLTLCPLSSINRNKYRDCRRDLSKRYTVRPGPGISFSLHLLYSVLYSRYFFVHGLFSRVFLSVVNSFYVNELAGSARNVSTSQRTRRVLSIVTDYRPINSNAIGHVDRPIN